MQLIGFIIVGAMLLFTVQALGELAVLFRSMALSSPTDVDLSMKHGMRAKSGEVGKKWNDNMIA